VDKYKKLYSDKFGMTSFRSNVKSRKPIEEILPSDYTNSPEEEKACSWSEEYLKFTNQN